MDSPTGFSATTVVTPCQRQDPGAHSQLGSPVRCPSGCIGGVVCPSDGAGMPTGIATRPPIWTTEAQGTSSPTCTRVFPDKSWSELDTILLTHMFDSRCRVLQRCLHHLRGRFRQSARCALEARHDEVSAGDRIAESRARKLFCLLPFLLLRKPVGQGRVVKSEACGRGGPRSRRRAWVPSGEGGLSRKNLAPHNNKRENTP